MFDQNQARAAAASLTITLACGWACAQATDGIDVVMSGPDAITMSGLEWKEATSIPPGAYMVMIHGNPGKAGAYIFRVKFPAGYKLPAHKHQDQRAVTVLSGSYWSAAGDTFEQSKLAKFAPGAYYVTGPGVAHFAWAETDVVIQEMGTGPVSDPIEYIDVGEDPRKK